jgi:hypothetical protein
MADFEKDNGLIDRLSHQGEEALGRIAEELIGNSVVNGAVARAFDAREKAVQAQEAAMGALGIPSAADIERVTRRLRSVSQRLEGIEDALDRLEEHAAAPPGTDLGGERLAAIERRLERISADVAGLRESAAVPAPAPRAPRKTTPRKKTKRAATKPSA